MLRGQVAGLIRSTNPQEFAVVSALTSFQDAHARAFQSFGNFGRLSTYRFLGDKHLAGPSHVGLFICETLKVKHYTYHGHNIFLEAFMSRLVSHSHSPFAKFIEYHSRPIIFFRWLLWPENTRVLRLDSRKLGSVVTKWSQEVTMSSHRLSALERDYLWT